MNKIKYINVQKKILTRSLLFIVVILLLFSILLTFLLERNTRTVRNKNLITNTQILNDILSPFPKLIDTIYLNTIDAPMEDIFKTPEFISFSFSTDQYPANDTLLLRLKNIFLELTNSTSYITTTFLYASNTDEYVSDQSSAIFNNNDTESEFFSDIIYIYNSNTIEKTQILNSDHHTFMFHYKDSIVISKDLTTLSGQTHATLFVVLDSVLFYNYLYGLYPFLAQCDISIYDLHNRLIYSNINAENESMNSDILDITGLSLQNSASDGITPLFYRSDILQFQYYLKYDPSNSSYNTNNVLTLYGTVIATILLVAIIFVIILLLLLYKPSKNILGLLNFQKTEHRPSTYNLLSVVKNSIHDLSTENQKLSKIVSSFSTEALSSLFSQLIIGRHVDDEKIQIALNNSDAGFKANDIYVSGIVKYTGIEFIDMEERYRIINLINVTFDKFKSKTACSCFIFSSSNSTFAIIVSFAYQTSIAQGKTKVNELISLLDESFEFSRLPLVTAFGHMYNSILDLSFSYNEALKIIRHTEEPHYEQIADQQANIQRDEVLENIRSDTALNAGETPNSDEDPSKVSLSIQPISITDIPSLIDRRAAQIPKLIFDKRETDVSRLVDRTLTDIFTETSFDKQFEYIKQLISAVTDSIISYQFIDFSQISDVYTHVCNRITAKTAVSEMKIIVQEAINTLCLDFSNVLEKQRNPYIVSALAYIEANYSKSDLSLEEIAESLKIAPNYLSTIFSKNLSTKLFEYISKYRLEKSIEMLINTDKSINDISTENGFGTARNYIRIFKKYKELTPGAYRKQHLTQNIHSTQEV